MTNFTRRQSLGGIFGLSLLPTLAARSAGAAGKAAATKLLAFDLPAARWIDAFPVGNGRVAAMVFGGVTA